MIRINKIWSEDKCFKELKFESGLNFIVGESSKDESGIVKNKQRNGSGKSLSIELINFVLLKRSNESRIFEVPDSILPPKSFVYGNFTIDDSDVTIARNKSGVVLMKLGTGDYTEVNEATAKKELENLLSLDSCLSFRELANFLIKEAGYSYTNFLYFYTSNAIDRLKASLYFFDLPIEVFQNLRKKQEQYEDYGGALRLTKSKIESKKTTIDQLRSLQTELEFRVNEIEKGLSYEQISKEVTDTTKKLEVEEASLTDLLRKRGRLEYQLGEIEEFLTHNDEESLVTDKELQKFFNRYVKGLGDFVQADLEKLQNFRDEISLFENEMLTEQIQTVKSALVQVKERINQKIKEIDKFRAVIDNGKNHLQRGLRLSNNLMNEFQENKKLLEDFNEYDIKMREVNSEFQALYSELDSLFIKMTNLENSFRKTFLDIHEKVYENKSGVFSFVLNEKRNIRDKEFFKIKAVAKRQGSDGVNRVRQVIYDLSLLTNEHTSKRSQGLIVHDRMLFGDIDNETTFNILNYMHSLPRDTFQYIGTYNSDVISKEQEVNDLKFDIKSHIPIELTVEDPLFFKQFDQQLDYQHTDITDNE